MTLKQSNVGLPNTELQLGTEGRKKNPEKAWRIKTASLLARTCSGFASRLLALLATSILLLGSLHLARATAITGSFYVPTSTLTYPVLFEIRRTPEMGFLMGCLLWDVYYLVTDATFNADGSVQTIDVFDGAEIIKFDLTQQKAVSAGGVVVGISGIQQTQGPGRTPFHVTMGIQKSAAGIELSWNSIADRSYLVLTKSAVTAPWEIVDSVTAMGDTSTWQAPIDPNENQRFYGLMKGISFNGQALSADDLAELELTYGALPYPGDYWYDTVSGLWGVVGYAAYGVMYQGHTFGSVPRDASIGNTQVLINGRELPLSELWLWSLILGGPIQAGSYWLDGSGNYGIGDTPSVSSLVGNLRDLANQQSYHPGSGGSPTGGTNGGDNFWATGMTAGNSSGGAGYISVPGEGPIGTGTLGGGDQFEDGGDW